jgi:hypothetical protein
MSETLLKDIYNVVVGIRRKLELLEDAIIPKEKVSEEELFEIQKLKEESAKGEHVEWEERKREH